MPPRHIPALDGMRGVAVLLVVCFHFWNRMSPDPGGWIGKIAPMGQTGVDLFFVLSGFLITGILLDSKGSAHFLRNFYVRRILRIFPLYYLTLIAIYVAAPLLHLSAWTPWTKQWWFWTYLQNMPMTFSPASVSGPGHFWSLSVEEQYYFVWPFLVLRLSRAGLLKVAAASIAVAMGARTLHNHFETFYFTLARLDGLAVGSAVAILMRDDRWGVERLARWGKRAVFALVPVLVAAQLLGRGRAHDWVEVGRGALIAIVYAGVMLMAIRGGALSRVLGGGGLGSVGKYSYAMYVFHPFLILGLRAAGLRYGWFELCVTVAATYVAGAISWILVERHFLRLKSRFEYAPARPRASASAAQSIPA